MRAHHVLICQLIKQPCILQLCNDIICKVAGEKHFNVNLIVNYFIRKSTSVRKCSVSVQYIYFQEVGKLQIQTCKLPQLQPQDPLNEPFWPRFLWVFLRKQWSILLLSKTMVLMLDGNSENGVHMCSKTGIFGIYFLFTTALPPNKCIEQFKLPISSCAHHFWVII